MGLCEQVDEMLREVGGVTGFNDQGFAGGHPRSAQTSRAPNYPYDNTDDESVIGQQSKEGEPLHHYLVPKNIDPDDHRFDEHAPTTLAELEEAMGVPFNVEMGDRSSRGNDIPGAIGGWSRVPAKPWDDPAKQRDHGIDVQEDFESDVPPVEPTEVPFGKNPHDQTDDQVETQVDRIWHRDDNTDLLSADDFEPGEIFGGDEPEMELIVQRPSGLDLIDVALAQLFSGLLPNESAWFSAENFSS